MKINKVKKAIALRKQGKSILEIGRIVDKAKSTVYGWVKNIPLTQKQRIQLLRNKGNNQKRATEAMQSKYAKYRTAWYKEGVEFARKREWLHLAGCMLYWAEGTKQRNTVRMSNTDIGILTLFLKFLKRYYAVQDNKIALDIRYFSGYKDEQSILQYWTDNLDLPTTCIKRVVVDGDPRSKLTNRKKHPYGICTVHWGNTEAHCKIMGSIAEYGRVAQLARVPT